jgi:serine protease AprX
MEMNVMRRRKTLSCLFVLLLAIPIFGSPMPAQTLDKLDPLVQQRVSLLAGSSEVIVRATDSASVGAVALLIQQVGGTLRRKLPIIDALAADVPNTSLLILADSSAIQRIALDRPTLGSLERTAATIGAAAVRQYLGYDGAGVGVAVIDSGITSWHDDLTDAGIPGSQRVDAFVDFVNGRSTPYDDYGHGTHVAGIIAGNGADAEGARAGIAPGAHLVVAKVLDDSGRGRISDVIAAFDYVINHQHAYNIRIVNLSIAAGVYESYNSDLFTLAARRVFEQGIVVVAAAGNLGSGSDGPQYGGIGAPGNAPWVVTVGASSHMGTVDRADDEIAAFSSRGPTAVDYSAKPDLVAPGVGIYSLSDPNSNFYLSKPQNRLSGTVATPYLPYLTLTGTSMAAPVVAGTVALMLQANPALTPNAVKAILEYTAQMYPGYDALTQGAGFLNARGAVDLARYLTWASTGSYPTPADWSRQLVWGNRRIQGGYLTADASAWSNGVVWGQRATNSAPTVTWGLMCSGAGCETGGGTWSTWGTGDLGNSENVVWGSACSGADCQGTSWSASGAGTVEGATIVWGEDWESSRAVIW